MIDGPRAHGVLKLKKSNNIHNDDDLIGSSLKVYKRRKVGKYGITTLKNMIDWQTREQKERLEID